LSIEVESLSKHYGSQIAVNAISFKAVPGRIMGFLGPNGAGKSTTMKMLTGYLQPNSGKVHVGGFNVLTQGMEVKRIMGYLPENTPLYTDMYVKEFLSFAGQTYQLSNLNRIVAEVIERVGLGPEQHKKIGQLSKGYRQRVGLAQAIVHDPRVLILDEPTSGLDPNQLADIRKLIKELGKDKTVVFSTHIMQEAEAVCDDVVIINKGNIVANSSLADLKKDQDSTLLEDIFRKLTT
jgi:ABC-2 type transport system ATP-binding protein